MARITKATEYLRHNFTADERLTMGSELAAAHNTMSAIEEEENHIKATFKERKASVEQKIGTLSRELGSGFTMQNIECRLEYDYPNIGEVTYFRDDIKSIVKTRPMTAQERQQEIEFDKPVAVPPQTMEETVAAVDEFFEKAKDGELTITEVSIEDALILNDQAPQEARQTLLTMGDAKKGRKKKEPTPPVIPIAQETPVDLDDLPF